MGETTSTQAWRRWLRESVALLVMSGACIVAIPAAAHATDHEIAVDVTVVDAKGKPFRAGTGGAIACASEGWSVPCANLIVGVDDDGDGDAKLVVAPAVEYVVTGFATNTGWRDPDFVSEDGTDFHFSAVITANGADLDGHVFVIEKPTPDAGIIDIDVTVTDELHRPFPAGAAGVMVCPSDQPPAVCDPMIFASADATGTAHLELDPNTTYRFAALVADPGWPCGGWTSPSGTVFFFSDELVAHAARLSRPTTFVIIEPTC